MSLPLLNEAKHGNKEKNESTKKKKKKIERKVKRGRERDGFDLVGVYCFWLQVEESGKIKG